MVRPFRIYHRRISAAILVLLLFTSAALAAPPTNRENADFTFIVPVKLTNIPASYTQWSVKVFVKSLSDSIIAQSAQEFTVNGNLTQTFTIKLNADPGKNPKHAMKYALSMAVKVGNVWKPVSEIRDELDWLSCYPNEQKNLPQ